MPPAPNSLPTTRRKIHPAVVRRIVIAQSLYAAGAALCFFNTYYSIAAIVLVQVNYAIAPQFCWGLFSRLRDSIAIK